MSQYNLQYALPVRIVGYRGRIFHARGVPSSFRSASGPACRLAAYASFPRPLRSGVVRGEKTAREGQEASLMTGWGVGKFFQKSAS
jgi:hypothetical protein